MTVLAVNAGSSTLKFALYRVDNDPEGPALISGMVDGLATGGAMPLRWTANGETFKTLVQTQDKEPFACALHALQALLQDAAAADSLSAVAHRVVHGGGVYHQAVAVDATVLEALERFSPLAPLHQPHNVAGIRAFAKAFPALPQIACFDTAFHATLPEVEYTFALPQSLSEQGIRRYGFHGLSYQYVLGCLGRLTPRATGRVIMAHLGSGASLCATNQGQSQATTMGFSALDGLMMGTRCGALDAGVLLHLLGEGWDRAQLEDLLYRRSGLLGVSGLSGDMRQLRASDDERARLAVKMFGYRVAREAGAMAACLSGLDVLVFTGGIGEHDSALRAAVCQQLAFLGITLDPDRNAQPNTGVAAQLHADGSPVEVWMVPTDEGRVAAQAAVALLRAAN